MKLESVGENELVAKLTHGLPLGAHVIAGAGDDCAVLESGGKRGWLQLFKTDCIVEGVHFDRGADPERVGWKAMARATSDIAAMGGLPTDAVVTAVLPATCELDYVERIYSGLRRCAERFGISIVGGETSSTPKSVTGAGIVLSVAMLGQVERNRCILRSGGQSGDAVFVTGRLGGSIEGKHLTFVPRVAEARWLVSQFRIRAMMDVSDGIAQDLPRLAKASALGFELDKDTIPCNEGCDIAAALADGEDYELLFTLSGRREKALLEAWCAEFPELALTRIGKLTAVDSADGHPTGGWDHFG